MKNWLDLLPIFFFIFFFTIFPVLSLQSANAYQFVSVFHDDASVNNIVYPQSFFYTGDCSVNTFLYATADNSGMPYTLGNAWYSPNDSLITSTNPPYTQSQTCGFQGNYTRYNQSLANFYNAKTTTTTTATITHTWAKTIYNCDPAGNTNQLSSLITYYNTTGHDSFGYHPYGYMQTLWTYLSAVYQAEPSKAILRANALGNMTEYEGSCAGTTLTKDDDDAASRTGALGLTAGMAFWLIIPFNSQYAGKVNISIPAQSITKTALWTSCISGQYIELYDRTTGEWQSLGSGIPFSTNLNLPIGQSRDYYLMIGSVCTDGGAQNGASASYKDTTYSINISGYIPDISCGAYGSCSGGSRFKDCIDLNGILPPWQDYDTAGCFVVSSISFLNDLGFEDSYSRLIGYCALNWGLLGCDATPFNISSDYPVNWTIGQGSIDNSGVMRQNFLKITSEGGSRAGTKSLKMWYIPPKPYEPLNDGSGGTICGNATSGNFPEVDTPYNDTLFLAANISFPSPFMDIRYSVKRCSVVPLQYDYTGDFFGINCGKRCYSSTCNDTPKGIYGVRLMDTADNSFIFDIHGDAPFTWNDYIVDISNKGLKTNHNYTLAIAVNPENSQDPYSSCIYFDKIQATIRQAAITSCNSYCDDNFTRYEAISTNPCIYSIKPDRLCVSDITKSQEVDEVISGSRNYTCIGNDAFTYNRNAGTLDRTINAPFCITQNAAANLTTPGDQSITSIDFNIFLNVGFIFSVIILCLCVGITFYIKSGWPIALFGIIQFVFVCSMVGLISIYFGIGIIFIGALIFAWFISNTV